MTGLRDSRPALTPGVRFLYSSLGECAPVGGMQLNFNGFVFGGMRCATAGT